MESKEIARETDEDTCSACVTLRAAVLQRFPPGRERRAWLAWIQRLGSGNTRLRRGHTAGPPSSECKRQVT